MKKKLAKLLNSKSFKKIALILAIAFSFLSFFITARPESFLKSGYLGIFGFNLFGPGTLLIPSLATRMNLFGLAIATSLGMSLNDSVAWVIGASGDVIIPRSKKVLKAEEVVQRYGIYGLFFLSLLPLPYDFIGLIAGYLQISYRKFFIPTFSGRFLRMILIGLGTIALF